MAQIRAILTQAIAEAKELHDVVTIPNAQGDRREAAIDLSRQIDNGREELESVRDYFRPLKEHSDQVLLRIVEVSDA